MNKAALVKAVAEKAGMTQRKTAEVVDAVLNSLVEALQNGEEVRVHGFGKFTVAERAARTARNPKTGELVQVPAKKAVRFKAAKQLKEAVK